MDSVDGMVLCVGILEEFVPAADYQRILQDKLHWGVFWLMT